MRHFFQRVLVLFVSFTAAFLFTPAHAADFYVAKTATGAANGTSAANAYAVSFFNTAGNWGSGAGKISPGDTVHLIGVISTTLSVQGSGSSGSPITILFEPGAKLSTAFWGLDSAGAMSISGKNFITIDGANTGIIECTANGDGLANQQPATGIYAVGCGNLEIRNLTIQNIYKHLFNTDNVVSAYTTQCIKASGCNHLSIHDNVLNHAYVAVYAYTESAVALSDLKIFNNTLSACSTDIIAALGSPGSSMDSLTICNNDITMGTNWFDTPDNNHVDGIHIWTSNNGSITNLNILNNSIHGDPTTHCTGYLYLENHIVSVLIANNLLVGSTNHPAEAYIAFNLSETNNAYLFNNTIVGLGSTNIGGNAIAFDPSQPGTTGHIKNNLIANCYAGIYDANATTVWDSDYNMFYQCGNVGRLAVFETTLASWQAGSGADAHSMTANPLFNSDYTIPTNSPAAASGIALYAYVQSDKAGHERSVSGPWDLGCYLAGASGVPVKMVLPSNAVIYIAVQ